ncbi:unnamed protein product [Lepeophtheirus salmonis]|uniref:(salmon louse) hypothetical protein n=1 Tax=Lepeophtheirus salmonis TaxID=72036 RepID=A0A7R8D2H4_LEPSM|nr:unnamed protein product [Lepeophtheirus salmonis]CAF2976530.1 unnamed protein product [Lepeophtheirus salmonis]
MEGEEDSANMNLYLSGGSILLTGAVAALTLLLNRKLSNPSFLLLNCWFCNENFSIPLRKAKSWTCPSCDGYNGFSNDGDYNTDLKTSSLRPQRYARPQIKAPIHSDLCRDCELNQCLKVSQLSAFVPKDERNFDMEIEDYEAHLERVYRLCRQCEAALHQKLGEQDAKIRPNLLSWRLESNRLAAKRDGGISAFVHATPRASKAKRFFSSRVSSIFNAKEDECHEENSKYDISSLSIEDNVETEFTLMGSGLHLKAIAKASWVAGGYWHPKDKLGLSSPERTLSRSSSQSSGFVSYDNYPSSPNLRVIRNTFARSSVPPEHKPYEQFPVRQVASSSDRYSCDDPSFHGNTGFVDSSSSLASSSRQCLNDSPNKSHNVSIMDKEFNL